MLTDDTLQDYLQRVGLSAPPSVDEIGLRRLQWAQSSAIAFENLDIQLGRAIDLSAERLVQKLIYSKRGGYCFELNGLMLLVLQSLGFEARPLLARVHLGDTPSGRTHQINCVTVDAGQFIVDVGFGAGGPRCPIPLQEGVIESDIGIMYRLQRRAPWGWMLETKEQEWKDSYSFELDHVIPIDIEVSNHYCSSSPSSQFTQARMASLPGKAGRISLRNHTFTRQKYGQTTVEQWPPGPEYIELLEQHFGISLDTEFGAFIPPAPD